MSKFGVWNSKQKKFQFKSCDSYIKTEVLEKLRKKIGDDSNDEKFIIVDKKEHLKQLNDKKIGLKTVLWFGIYKGKKVKEVLENNPDYIAWCKNNIKMKFKDEVLWRFFE